MRFWLLSLSICCLLTAPLAAQVGGLFTYDFLSLPASARVSALGADREPVCGRGERQHAPGGRAGGVEQGQFDELALAQGRLAQQNMDYYASGRAGRKLGRLGLMEFSPVM